VTSGGREKGDEGAEVVKKGRERMEERRKERRRCGGGGDEIMIRGGNLKEKSSFTRLDDKLRGRRNRWLVLGREEADARRGVVCLGLEVGGSRWVNEGLEELKRKGNEGGERGCWIDAEARKTLQRESSWR